MPGQLTLPLLGIQDLKMMRGLVTPVTIGSVKRAKKNDRGKTFAEDGDLNGPCGVVYACKVFHFNENNGK
jgi:hypothetical protein